MSEYLQATPESERVEALFCENDVLALGALEALRQTAPSSAMAVVGFDDIDEAGSANWALTSYSQRIDRLVEEALNRLIDNRATADGTGGTGNCGFGGRIWLGNRRKASFLCDDVTIEA